MRRPRNANGVRALVEFGGSPCYLKLAVAAIAVAEWPGLVLVITGSS